MNISKINLLPQTFGLKETETTGSIAVSAPKYGIKMANQLQTDTVSFKGALNSNKGLGDLANAVSNLVSMQIREIYKKPHADMKNAINKYFSDILSNEKEKSLITLFDRIKKGFSICEKTTTIDVNTKRQILEDMQDISGFAFVLENGKSFQQFIKRASQFFKEQNYQVVDMEYYRLPPKVKKGKVVESYDSLNENQVSKLATNVDEINGVPIGKTILNIKPSPAGYSGLHITLKDKNGLYHEWQIMTRSMWNGKEIENLFYKAKSGKSIDPKYSYVDDVLQPLRPLPEYAPDKEKSVHKAFLDKIKAYTVDFYKNLLKKPFEDSKEFLRPSDPEIQKFDMNNIYKLMQACENM